jgi:hypothetical protein
MLIATPGSSHNPNNICSGGYGSRIALAEPVSGRAFARPVGSLVRDDEWVSSTLHESLFDHEVTGLAVVALDEAARIEHLA